MSKFKLEFDLTEDFSVKALDALAQVNKNPPTSKPFPDLDSWFRFILRFYASESQRNIISSREKGLLSGLDLSVPEAKQQPQGKHYVLTVGELLHVTLNEIVPYENGLARKRAEELSRVNGSLMQPVLVATVDELARNIIIDNIALYWREAFREQLEKEDG